MAVVIVLVYFQSTWSHLDWQVSVVVVVFIVVLVVLVNVMMECVNVIKQDNF